MQSIYSKEQLKVLESDEHNLYINSATEFGSYWYADSKLTSNEVTRLSIQICFQNNKSIPETVGSRAHSQQPVALEMIALQTHQFTSMQQICQL